MTTFLQLHMLTSYPPACLNRDDLNRPKTAVMGGVQRLRISSQSLKRAWRTSDVFMSQLTGQTGIRSKELGRKIKDALLSGITLGKLMEPNPPEAKPDDKIKDAQAAEWAWIITSEFVDKKSKGVDDGGGSKETEEKERGKKVGKDNVKKDTLKSEQIVFYSCAEIKAMDSLIMQLREQRKAPTPKQLSAIMIKSAGGAADLALFGRMLASSPDYNVEAACQVAHAITVHKVAVEDDFFTAVDDLNKREEDAGSAHLGEQGFAAGLFYSYVCIDCDSLKKNLNEDAILTGKAIRALTEAAATVAPTGKMNSFGNRAWSQYLLAEKGERQPRSLSVAFLEPVQGDNMLDAAVKKLEETRKNLDGVYFGWEEKESEEKDEKGKKKVIKEAKSLPSYCINAMAGNGDFQALLKFVEK